MSICLFCYFAHAEERKHKYGKDIIKGHDRSRCGLRETEVVCEDERDYSVVSLPEGCDEEESHSDKNCTLVI